MEFKKLIRLPVAYIYYRCPKYKCKYRVNLIVKILDPVSKEFLISPNILVNNYLVLAIITIVGVQ